MNLFYFVLPGIMYSKWIERMSVHFSTRKPRCIYACSVAIIQHECCAGIEGRKSGRKEETRKPEPISCTPISNRIVMHCSSHASTCVCGRGKIKYGWWWPSARPIPLLCCCMYYVHPFVCPCCITCTLLLSSPVFSFHTHASNHAFHVRACTRYHTPPARA